MKNRHPVPPLAWVFLVFALAPLYAVAGGLLSCSSSGSGLEGLAPAPALVSASRAVYDQLADELRAAIQADASLSPLVRDQELSLVDDWRLAIEAAESLLAVETAPAASPEVPGSGEIPR